METCYNCERVEIDLNDPADSDHPTLCTRCAANVRFSEWVDATEDRLEAACGEHAVIRLDSIASTGSRYYLVAPIERGIEDGEEWEEEGKDAFGIRLADHSECYPPKNGLEQYALSPDGLDCSVDFAVAKIEALRKVCE